MLSEYPAVRVSECKHFNIFQMAVGARFCTKCNAIILFFPHCRKEFDVIEESTVEILNHEIMHWVIFKEIGEQASADFDAIAKSDIYGL